VPAVICPRCGTYHQGSVQTCASCGKSLTPASEQLAAEAQTVSAQAPAPVPAPPVGDDPAGTPLSAAEFPQADRVPPMRMILISVALSLLIVSVLFSVLSPRSQPPVKGAAKADGPVAATDTAGQPANQAAAPEARASAETPVPVPPVTADNDEAKTTAAEDSASTRQPTPAPTAAKLASRDGPGHPAAHRRESATSTQVPPAPGRAKAMPVAAKSLDELLK
jgi:hypothetical protein